LRKSRVLPVIAVAFLGACQTTSGLRLMIEMPRPSSLRLDTFNELLITDFLVQKEVAGLALNKELTEYFKSEWERKFKGKVGLANAAPAGEADFKSAEVLRTLAGNSPRSLVMTGRAAFSRESRKGLQEKEPGWRDGYFQAQNILSERQVFTLEMGLFFIKGETGEVLFQRDYKEIRTYKSAKQRVEFAFFDLLQTAKQKLFNAILGNERFQEWYLISK